MDLLSSSMPAALHRTDSARRMFWQKCRSRGLIPGPTETEFQFLKRVERSPPITSISYPSLVELFGTAPDWLIPISPSTALRPWEGAVTFIEEDAEGLYSASIHIGKSLFLSAAHLVSHEWVHAMRCGFPDSLGEEVLAWRTCPHRIFRGLAFLTFDLFQLLLSAGVVVGLLFAVVFEDLWPCLWSFILALGLWKRGWNITRPYTLAIRELAKSEWPTWPILLHLSFEEVLAFSRDPATFWQFFVTSSHFRFEFMQATFAMLRSN